MGQQQGIIGYLRKAEVGFTIRFLPAQIVDGQCSFPSSFAEEGLRVDSSCVFLNRDEPSLYRRDAEQRIGEDGKICFKVVNVPVRWESIKECLSEPDFRIEKIGKG